MFDTLSVPRKVSSLLGILYGGRTTQFRKVRKYNSEAKLVG